ncbi:MAG: response regulator [Proteobacteria bacterium]|nr:response regulator [Pseudomonadota bacterium]MBU4297658.1 response regulator [Pseudomonadota bacterium]
MENKDHFAEALEKRCTELEKQVFYYKTIAEETGRTRLREIEQLNRQISERKKAEEKLKESDKRIRSWLEYSPVCTKILDRNFNMQYMSSACINNLQIEDITQFYGKQFPFDCYPEPTRNVIIKNLETIRETGEIITLETPVFNMERDELWFQSTFVPVTDKEGLCDYIIVVSVDITDRKRAEKTQANLAKRLQQAQKMEAIGTLAGGIAHDFNNILSAIIGFTELAKIELKDGRNASANLAKVLQASHRAAELVRQILTFSRKGAYKREPLQPYLTVKEALKLIRASLPTTIEIQENIDPKSGSIWADPTQIHQIIINLCTNAHHAMEEESGLLSVSLLRKELSAENVLGYPGVSPGPFIEISISDTGCGMDKQTQKRIFEPFFTTKEKGKGTGLGLSVVLGVVQDYEGMITVESELGKGTTFHVYFPAIIEDVETPVEAEEVKPLPIGTESILTVDDETIIVALHEAVLSRLGYTVMSKTSSEEALAAFKTDPQSFDLLITDQAMPALSGAKLAEEVLSLRPDMPIILCTGYSSTISEEKAMEIGIKRYLKKPVDGKALAEAVRDVLDSIKLNRVTPNTKRARTRIF